VGACFLPSTSDCKLWCFFSAGCPLSGGSDEYGSPPAEVAGYAFGCFTLKLSQLLHRFRLVRRRDCADHFLNGAKDLIELGSRNLRAYDLVAPNDVASYCNGSAADVDSAVLADTTLLVAHLDSFLRVQFALSRLVLQPIKPRSKWSVARGPYKRGRITILVPGGVKVKHDGSRRARQ
jgi:hypothetical protein